MDVNYSMTGYGLQELRDQELEVKVEMKSVNSRFLEINIRMPRNFLSLEMELRSLVQEKLSRGKLDIFINVNASASLKRELVIDYSLIEQITDLLSDDKLPLEKNFSLRDLMALEGALVFKDKKMIG